MVQRLNLTWLPVDHTSQYCGRSHTYIPRIPYTCTCIYTLLTRSLYHVRDSTPVTTSTSPAKGWSISKHESSPVLSHESSPYFCFMSPPPMLPHILSLIWWVPLFQGLIGWERGSAGITCSTMTTNMTPEHHCLQRYLEREESVDLDHWNKATRGMSPFVATPSLAATCLGLL